MNGAELSEALRRLKDLSMAGWKWMPPGLDDEGELVELFGLRVFPAGYADVVKVRDVGDVMALRVDHEGGIVWQRSGALGEIVDALLELPAPGMPGAPRLVIGYAPSDLRLA